MCLNLRLKSFQFFVIFKDHRYMDIYVTLHNDQVFFPFSLLFSFMEGFFNDLCYCAALFSVILFCSSSGEWLRKV